MQTELGKVAFVIIHLFLGGIFVLFSFAIFGDQLWLPYFWGVVLLGIVMYVLFILGCIMLIDYFDKRGEFDRHENEEEN